MMDQPQKPQSQAFGGAGGLPMRLGDGPSLSAGNMPLFRQPPNTVSYVLVDGKAQSYVTKLAAKLAATQISVSTPTSPSLFAQRFGSVQQRIAESSSPVRLQQQQQQQQHGDATDGQHGDAADGGPQQLTAMQRLQLLHQQQQLQLQQQQYQQLQQLQLQQQQQQQRQLSQLQQQQQPPSPTSPACAAQEADAQVVRPTTAAWGVGSTFMGPTAFASPAPKRATIAACSPATAGLGPGSIGSFKRASTETGSPLLTRTSSDRAPILAVASRGFQPANHQQQLEEEMRRQKLVYLPRSQSQRMYAYKSSSFSGHSADHAAIEQAAQAAQLSSMHTMPARASQTYGQQTALIPGWQAALSPTRTPEPAVPLARRSGIIRSMTPTKAAVQAMASPAADGSSELLGGSRMQVLQQAGLAAAPLEPTPPAVPLARSTSQRPSLLLQSPARRSLRDSSGGVWSPSPAAATTNVHAGGVADMPSESAPGLEALAGMQLPVSGQLPRPATAMGRHGQ